MPNEVDAGKTRVVVSSYREPGNGLRFLDDTHRSYDPLQYPLLFPTGLDGWHLGIPAHIDTEQRRVSLKIHF